MKLWDVRPTLALVVMSGVVVGQSMDRNPVDVLKEQATQALAAADVPFTPDQETQLAIAIEDEHLAAENLFGTVWDFSNGPPQGEDQDRMLAGIQWMRDDFAKRLPSYMTESQKAAWEKYQASAAPETRVERKEASKERIQQIRVTNNAFNVETGTANGAGGLAQGGAKTEVIERGGVGAWHGNFMSMFKDNALNARNPFVENRPPFYERTINANVSGPVIRNRLTLNFTGIDDLAQNNDTVRAQLPDGLFTLGVTHPVLNRSYNLKGMWQIADAHSLNIGYTYASTDSKNENPSNFVLPERAAHTQISNSSVDLREISILSERSVHDVHFTMTKDHRSTVPASEALSIIVKDAFTAGGAQNRIRIDGTTYNVSNLFYYAGDKLTMRSGVQTYYRKERNFDQSNFFGEFTFSSLTDYVAGHPIKFRITCCEPSFQTDLFTTALFSQNDIKLSKTFTLMLGARYFYQTRIPDYNQFDPRIGFAYAIGNSTVIRGGTGVFRNQTDITEFKPYLILDGQKRYEIQIDNPGWPDPFAAGTVRPISRRVIAPHFKNPYYFASQLGIERQLPANLFVTVSYEIDRGGHPNRDRDINAPLWETGIRPNPYEGQVVQIESSGASLHQHFSVTMRQRVSIFNITGNYQFYHGVSDSPPVNGTMPLDSYNLRKEWGPAGNPTHRASASLNSKLPMGVFLTTSINAKTGTFYTITTGKLNREGNLVERPLGVGKNTEIGPHYFDVSFNITKSFPLHHLTGALPQRRTTTNAPGANTGAGPQMNVFANISNAFNMTHLGTPSGVMTSPFFMKSYNSSGDARTLQVGMRFQF
jgi:hypothetical protein